MKRRILDRLLDFAWSRTTRSLTCTSKGLPVWKGPEEGSVSSSMAWPGACAEIADGRSPSTCFRRRSSVREVVETPGPSDARFHVDRILRSAPELLDDPRVKAVDNWGDPIRCPGILLGLPSGFSPTTLRYLSHAIWLRDNHLIEAGGHIVEIGVGFGGLAAMNAIVSGARTSLVDLEPVTAAAMRMLAETGLGEFARPATGDQPASRYCAISNYAFSEMSRTLQDDYLKRYLRGSGSGMIISNAAVFAASIGGRSDHELEEALREAGIGSRRSHQDPPLGPTDHLVGACLHVWHA